MLADDFRELYQRIEYLRNGGIRMKEIADCMDMAPSVLSSLYTTVLPTYFNALKSNTSDEALDQALGQVNNVSKRRLLTSLPDMLLRLDNIQLNEPNSLKGNPFAEQLMEEMQLSARKIEHISGIYYSYSLSSSSDCLKLEPFIIMQSESHARIGRLSAYGEQQWGFIVAGDPQNFYCLFNESPSPQLTLVSVFLQVPLFKHPRQLRGLYIGLDYNRNPVARRILLIKVSESTEMTQFLSLESGLISKEDFTVEQQAYYDYTCQAGDFIKMCTVPSLQMNETDLIKEKKMLDL